MNDLCTVGKQADITLMFQVAFPIIPDGFWRIND